MTTARNIANAKLTIGSTSISLGSTAVTTISGLTLSGATLTGSLTANGSTGTSGYLLSSTGAGVQWITPPAGYLAPTIGSTQIVSNTTYTTLPGVTSVNGTTIPLNGTLITSATTSLPSVTSVNGISLTPATTGFSIAGGSTTSKTLTLSNTLTLAGTDASTLNIGAGGTLGTAAFTAATAYQTSNTTLTGVAGLSSSGTGLVKNTAGTWSYDTNAYIAGSSPTITTPVIDSISASAVGAATSLHPTVTTGSIAIGAGLTTGALNIAASGTDITPITIGHTNATIALNGAITTSSTINKVTITAPTTSATLTLITGSTLATGTAASLTLSLSSAATTVATIPSGTVILQDLGTAQSITGVKTFSTAPIISSITNIGTITLPTATGTLALNPTTTQGDVIYASATGTPGTLQRLAPSATNGYVLAYDTSLNAPKWASAPAPTTVAGVRASTPILAKQSYVGSNNIIPIYTSPLGYDTAIDSLSFTNMNAGAASVKLFLTNKNIENQKFAATSNNTTTAASSTDGITWTLRTMPSALGWNSATYGNGVFVAVSNNTTTAASSADGGITWTLRTMPASVAWQSVTYGNGVFAVVGQATTTAASSTDGITWTLRTMPSATNWYSVTYGNGVFAAIAINTTTAASSTDGITWTLRTMPASTSWVSTTYGNGVFAAISQTTTTAASSTDGITWTLRTLPSALNWYSVTYGNGVFAAIALTTTTAASSTDGITWTLRTLPSAVAWRSVGSGHMQDTEIIYKNASIAANGTTWIDANKYDPIFIPAGYSLIAQSSVSPVNIQISGERWVNV